MTRLVTPPVTRLVLASNNAAKLVELRALLADLPVLLQAQGGLGVAEAEEPHHTFVENALAKARHAAQGTGCAAMADDSGLCVDALGGAPGVISAHFAGLVLPLPDREQTRRAQDAANNLHLLRCLAALHEPQRADSHWPSQTPRPTPAEASRSASFVCTLVAIRSADDPEPLIATGRWRGRILQAPRGGHGFGYDPLMEIPALGATVAELGADRKNLLSHRALAAAQLRVLLREVWRLQ